MKQLVMGLSLIMLSTGAFAQSGSSAATAENSVEFSAGVFTGLNSTFNNSKDQEEAATGPFVRPNFGLNAKTGDFTFAPSIVMEIAGQYNSTQDGTNNFQDGTWFQMVPALSSSYQINDTLSTNVLGLVDLIIQSDAEASNYADFYLRPDIQYQITDNTSIKVAYVLNRSDSFDALDTSRATDDPQFTAVTTEQANAAVPVSSPKKSSTSTLHAAQVTVSHPLTNSLNMSTYVRSGYRLQHGAESGNDLPAYRLQSNVSGPIFDEDLTATLVYRLNVQKDIGKFNYYNRGYINFDFAINDTWGVATENTVTAATTTASDATTSYEWDNYIGAKYSF